MGMHGVERHVCVFGDGEWDFEVDCLVQRYM